MWRVSNPHDYFVLGRFQDFHDYVQLVETVLKVLIWGFVLSRLVFRELVSEMLILTVLVPWILELNVLVLGVLILEIFVPGVLILEVLSQEHWQDLK